MLGKIYKETYQAVGIRALRCTIFFFYIFYIVNLLVVVLASNLEKYFVDNVLESSSHQALLAVVLLFAASAVVAYMACILIARYRAEIHMQIAGTLKKYLVKKIFSRPVEHACGIDPDDLKMRVDEDADMLIKFHESVYGTLIPAAVSFVLFSVLMLKISIWMSLVLICLAAASNLAELRIGKALDRLNLEVREKTNRINNLMYSELSNYVPFKARNMQEANYEAFTVGQDRLKDAYYTWMFSHIKLIVLQIVKTDFLQKAIIYLSSAYGVLTGRFSIGNTILMLNYFLSLNSYLSLIIREVTEYRSNVNSYSRCIGLLQSPAAREGGMQITDFEDLEIRELRFAYEGREVLTGTNLLVRGGEKVAVIGGSGQGKSTLIKCIAQVEKPADGKILINGIEIGNMPGYHQVVNVTMQDASLFNLSIWENLTLGDGCIDKERVYRVCERVGILQDIEELEEGFETKVGMDGAKLSGGQRQKLIIARVLLGGARVLILDEANSALDEESEEAINDYFLEYEGRTIIVVSHRRKTIDKFPKQFVLKEGKIWEYGH